MAATPEHAARVLGLGDDATLEDVRRVRRAMALRHHPDRSSDPSRSSRHLARINAAADTLTAHLKKTALPRSKRARPDYRNFAQQKTASGRSGQYSGQCRRAASAQSAPDNHAERTEKETRSKTSAPVLNMITSPEGAGRPSAADGALIRLAAASYRTVLDQISRIDTGPRVDTRALCYPHI
ncbi:DnaJ domain-containing protein [uncultured Roseobacter sp.]|uniref:DnaJ domain-containing protein n=1 Tax=uncultured Roseobacter sp. TaxID=114847 RepID=UPI00261E1BFC|nr:DnaJ domain-containing protein [uncultured Roseobacter sp.]